MKRRIKGCREETGNVERASRAAGTNDTPQSANTAEIEAGCLLLSVGPFVNWDKDTAYFEGYRQG